LIEKLLEDLVFDARAAVGSRLIDLVQFVQERSEIALAVHDHAGDDVFGEKFDGEFRLDAGRNTEFVQPEDIVHRHAFRGDMLFFPGNIGPDALRRDVEQSVAAVFRKG